MYTVYTHKHPRIDEGEVITEPSMTDQLADEPLDRLVQRYMVSGGKLAFGSADFEMNSKTTDKDVEAAFADLATEDVAAYDRVDAEEVLRQAREASAVLTEFAAAMEKQSTASGASVKNEATTDTPAFKSSQEQPEMAK